MHCTRRENSFPTTYISSHKSQNWGSENMQTKTRQLPDLVPQYRYEYKCSIILIVETRSSLWDTIPLIPLRFSNQNCHLEAGSAADHYPAYNRMLPTLFPMNLRYTGGQWWQRLLMNMASRMILSFWEVMCLWQREMVKNWKHGLLILDVVPISAQTGVNSSPTHHTHLLARYALVTLGSFLH